MSRKKSADIHRISGTYREDRHGNSSDLEIEIEEPLKPSWLSDHASEIWDRTLEKLMPLNILTSIDDISLAAYCELSAEFASNPVEFPSSKMAQLRSLMSSFGMNPADRNKVSAKKPTRKNQFSDL